MDQLEQFTKIKSFDDFPTERFKEKLENLTSTQESIDKAAKYALENLKYIQDLFDVLLNRMRKVSLF